MQQAASARPGTVIQQHSEAEEEDDTKLSLTCLFCPVTLSSLAALESHSTEHEGFRLSSVSASLQLDFYGRVRLVNYARQAVKDGFAASDVVQAVQSGGGWLADDRYLQPVLEDDALLCMLEDDEDDDDDWGGDSAGQAADDAEEDAEEEDDDDDDSEDGETTRERMLREARERTARREKTQRQQPPAAAASSGTTSNTAGFSSQSASVALVKENARLREQNEQLQEALAAMRAAMLDLTNAATASSSSSSPSPPPAAASSRDEKQQLPAASAATANGHAASVSFPPPVSDEDSGYFSGYSTRRIHELMLRDTTRTSAYQRFIASNPQLFRDKVVLDVGCGTGILSLFAAQAGARLVIGVDAADIADQARDIVKRNGYDDKVVIIKGKMEEAQLPVAAVDVIISEWMGYFMLYESMLPSVLSARDRFLPPSASSSPRVLPNRAVLYLAGMHDRRYTEEHVQYWHNVYGFDFSSLITDADRLTSGTTVETVAADSIVTDTAVLLSLNLDSCSVSDLDFTTAFTLQMQQTETVQAFCVWFDAAFDAESSVLLSTSPLSPKTHWMQTVFRLHTALQAKKGEQIVGQLSARRTSAYQRNYQVSISYAGNVQEYSID